MVKRLEQVAALVVAAGLAIVSYSGRCQRWSAGRARRHCRWPWWSGGEGVIPQGAEARLGSGSVRAEVAGPASDPIAW